VFCDGNTKKEWEIFSSEDGKSVVGDGDGMIERDL
jgi:hypothetical protein